MTKILFMFCACMLIVGCGSGDVQNITKELSEPGVDAVVYDCQGKIVKVQFNNDSEPQTAQLFFVNKNHEAIVLPLVPAASGAKYANDDITFWTHQGEAALSLTGNEESITCTESYAPQDAAEQIIDMNGNSVQRGCTVWFDGCNNCSVDAQGALACTRKACSPEIMTTARCLQAS